MLISLYRDTITPDSPFIVSAEAEKKNCDDKNAYL